MKRSQAETAAGLFNEAPSASPPPPPPSPSLQPIIPSESLRIFFFLLSGRHKSQTDESHFETVAARV